MGGGEIPKQLLMAQGKFGPHFEKKKFKCI